MLGSAPFDMNLFIFEFRDACRRGPPVREKELFYLRALLKDRPASSFQDLRTIDGVPFQTYQEAAIAQGLFQDLRESEYALTEAIADFSSPSELSLRRRS
jgi:hypothetical protein